jgi:hypothetical protein
MKVDPPEDQGFRRVFTCLYRLQVKVNRGHEAESSNVLQTTLWRTERAEVPALTGELT